MQVTLKTRGTSGVPKGVPTNAHLGYVSDYPSKTIGVNRFGCLKVPLGGTASIDRGARTSF